MRNAERMGGPENIRSKERSFFCRLLLFDGLVRSVVAESLLSKNGEALPRAQLFERDATQMASESGVNWFAVYVGARHEKSVGEQFRLRQMEAFLPLYKAVRRWKNGCKVNLELPLFPSYLFVRIEPRERLRVLQVPGVLSMVCGGREPVPVPKTVIESLRSAIALGQIEPHPYLVVGQRVRIKSGVLAGIEGVLVRKKENLRVVLSLDQIMQSAAVEVEGSEVEALGETRALPAAS